MIEPVNNIGLMGTFYITTRSLLLRKSTTFRSVVRGMITSVIRDLCPIGVLVTRFSLFLFLIKLLRRFCNFYDRLSVVDAVENRRE